MVSDRRRTTTIIAVERAEQTGIKGLGGGPGSDKGGIEIRDAGRLRLTAPVTEGSVDIVMGATFALADVAGSARPRSVVIERVLGGINQAGRAGRCRLGVTAV